MPARETKVNLLPPSDFELSFWGRFIKWAVTTGRYLIILTELVVIVAFLSRFKLDQDLTDINEDIKSQTLFLDSQIPTENKFLALQKRLNLVGEVYDSQSNLYELLTYIEAKIPKEITIAQLSVLKNTIDLTANTLSEQAMNKLLRELSSDKIWKSVDLTQVASDPTSGIRFTLSAKK